MKFEGGISELLLLKSLDPVFNFNPPNVVWSKLHYTIIRYTV